MTTSIQSIQNFYMNNNNFVFECTPFDISYNLLNEPALIDYAANSSLGFPDVSQVAILNIPPEYINNMFIFGNTTIPFDIFGLDELKYGIKNTSYNIPFSEANVSLTTTMRTLPNDYIKAINRDITNTDEIIFQNVSQMISDIKHLDSVFNLQIKQNISSNIIQNGTLQHYDSTPYAYACKQLISGILTYTTLDRKTRFFDDVSAQTPPYSVQFHSGDKLGMRISYIPKNGNGTVLPGLENSQPNNKLYTRSYKIILNVV
jgi:hypothetical protein